jgi:diguanylate cyclase (GGDEF)-like protein/PAS domain S-box-containing protein
MSSSKSARVSDPPRSKASREQGDRDLSSRMLRGVYTYPIMVSVFAVATNSFQQHPRLMWGITMVLASVLLARLGLIIGRPHLYVSRPSLWRGLLALTVVITASCCGYLHAALALAYGIESWPFLISAIWIAGLTAGGCLTFVPSMALVYCHLFLMELPIFLVSLRVGGTKSDAFALSVLFFVVFLVVQCRQLHTAYWQGLADRELEKDRRRELEAQAALLAEQAALLDLAQDAIVVRDMENRILFWNRGAEIMYGWPAKLAVTQIDFELLKTEFPQPIEEIEAQLLQQGHWEGELIHRTRVGIRLNVGARAVLQRDTDGAPVQVLILTNDITGRKEAEDTLFAEKERAQVTLKSIGDAVICTDISGNITFLNLVAEKMTGWSAQEAAGQPTAKVFRVLDATSRETIPNPMEMAIGRNGTMHLPSNCVLIRRDRLEIPIEDSVSPIHDRGGQVTGAVIVFRDVTAARTMALQMAHSAQHDFLTGLPNRMLLNDRLSQAINLASRRTKKVAVLFLDLDGFKHINDSLGHPIGDKLLQSVAKRLVDCVRVSDTVSRQGGDEFVVLLSEVEHPEDAAITARRMLQAVAEVHPLDQNDLHITASIGASVYPDDGLDAETLIKNADTAMYQAKENGRQSHQFFKPAMNVRAVERQSIEEGLRRALEGREFALHYQPKINLTTGEITGAEALIRWTHPIRGPVCPAQFIPVAEDCGLILPIGNWVLREACRQARAWIEAGLSAGTMAVNISAMEFRDDRFLEGVFAILGETGLDPRSLELELTESVLMKRVESTEAILKTLRARGVQVAVDDFGTGYSSLSYLRKFPIDALKIDQSFVRQITSTPDETSIVTAMISMGRSLKLRIVAEGVETHEELAFLQAHKCDEAQGYYFSRPLLPQQFTQLLETGISQTVLH